MLWNEKNPNFRPRAANGTFLKKDKIPERSQNQCLRIIANTAIAVGVLAIFVMFLMIASNAEAQHTSTHDFPAQYECDK